MFNFQTNLKKYNSGNQKFKAVFMRITKCVLLVIKLKCGKRDKNTEEEAF